MQKISALTTTANAAGEFTEGDSNAGVSSTLLKAGWFNTVQRELVKAIEGSGLALDSTNDAQLLAAIRLINQSGAVLYSTDTGAANAYAAAYTPAIATLVDGMVLRFSAKNANTGATTFAPDALAAKPVLGMAGKALQGGEILAGSRCALVWSSAASSWVLIYATGAAQQVADASTAQQAVNKGQMAAQAAMSSPPGMLAYFPANAAPSGWLKANGATLSRTTYAALWAFAQSSGALASTESAKLGGQFGPGDGSTTFTLPDLRGEHIRGWDDSRGVDSGRSLGTFQDWATADHSHNGTYVNGNQLATGSATGNGILSLYTASAPSGFANASSVVGPVTASRATETRVRNLAFLGCIKY